MRFNNRATNNLRDIKITRQYTRHAEGSILIEFGETRVLCNATVSSILPRFLKGKNQGWVTAEYGMLPRATHDRTDREAVRGKQGGRTLEIQRLIGRSLRAAVDLQALGEQMITIDCDVIQADGGTRTAAITGGCIALYDAIQSIHAKKPFTINPFKQFIAAVSVGIIQQTPMLDLDYQEDSTAETDMNIIMDEHGGFIELQGTAEQKSFSPDELNQMIQLATNGIQQLVTLQKAAVEIA